MTKVLYLITRYPRYPRTENILNGLSQEFDVTYICSWRKTYAARLIAVLLRFLFTTKRDQELLFVGFLAQPLLPLLRIFWRGPVICDAVISLHDALVFDRRRVSAGSPIGRLAKALDRYLFRTADLVYTDTAAHARYFEQLLDAPRDKMRRLFLSALEKWFRPVAAAPTDIRNGQICRVVFVGEFIPNQGVPTIIEAAAELRDDPYQFMLIGDGQTFAECTALASRLQLANVEFAGKRPLENVVAEVGAAHLVLGVFGDTPRTRNAIANKSFEALAMGKPLVTGDTPAMRELVGDDEVIFTRLTDPADLANKLRWARQHYPDALAIAARGHAAYRAKASNACIARQLNADVRDLLANQSPG